jgi:signal peptidase I
MSDDVETRPLHDNEPPGWDAPAPPKPPSAKETGSNPLVRLGVPQPWRTLIDWAVTIVGAIAIVLAIKAWVVNPYRIPSSSMEPTLLCSRPADGCTARFSDRVLACRFCYWFRNPQRGEIVVFNVPNKAKRACGARGVFVKRIVGLQGELWREKQGFVYINGKRLNEPYIKPERRDFASWPTRKIPHDNYLVMGDNRQSSCDSRRWGTVPRNRIIGKVIATYWPPTRIGFR